jgi:hypothetical protein
MSQTGSGSTDMATQARQNIQQAMSGLKEMSEATTITLLTMLTFSIIVIAFMYYFYYTGTGNFGGIAIIFILTIMFSILGQGIMDQKGAIIGGILGLIVGITIYVNMSNNMLTRECQLMDGVYGNLNTNIISINTTQPNFQNNFRDYYIKSAYNCCSGGNYKNDYVSMCTLKDLLKQGVRGLDFEIYSIDDQPVVATSTADNYCVKETFNYIKFSDIMSTVVNNAFSSSGAPNPADPIIFHLRIKSENQNMYKNFAKIFEQHSDLLMGKSYSFENMKNNHVTNYGATPLTEMMGKISIIVDRSNLAFLECKEFYEYVNMTSNSIFMRELTFDDIKYNSDIQELIEYNKLSMTIGIPNAGANPDNPSSVVLREAGCQMLAMRYQNIESNIEENEAFFNENNSAFVLKPIALRYTQVTVPAPPPQDPALSYKARTVSSQYYNFNI